MEGPVIPDQLWTIWYGSYSYSRINNCLNLWCSILIQSTMLNWHLLLHRRTFLYHAIRTLTVSKIFSAAASLHEHSWILYLWICEIKIVPVFLSIAIILTGIRLVFRFTMWSIQMNTMDVFMPNVRNLSSPAESTCYSYILSTNEFIPNHCWVDLTGCETSKAIYVIVIVMLNSTMRNR